MLPSHYFDHASSTPIAAEFLKEMTPWQQSGFGNAHSAHTWGRAARAAVDLARSRVSALVGCAPEELVFTSGATEANSWVVGSATRVAASPFEHSSVLEAVRARGGGELQNVGWRLPDPGPMSGLVCVMTVNNETGAVLSTPPLAGAKLLRDATQSLGKLPINLEGIDYASFSAHKLYGPQGVGALFAKDADFPPAMLKGGEHEWGFRAGTLNVAGIVGFGAACALATDEAPLRRAQAAECRDALHKSLAGISGVRRNDHEVNSPYIISVSIEGIVGETLVIEADARGFGISSGAACSSAKAETSHVLRALGHPERLANGTIRVSFGRTNSVESSVQLGKSLVEAVERLRRSPG